MNDVLIQKTAALGDVLRTTSILPGLTASGATRVTWLTAPGAVDLVRTHPLVQDVVPFDVRDPNAVARARERLGRTRWSRIISLDDEPPLCALASALNTDKLSGAYARPDGSCTYTSDVAEWFDMGLLSVHGKEVADRLKIANTKSQPRIYADMLGITMGKPELHLTHEARAFAARFAAENKLSRRRPLVALNTGAGGRWTSKQLSVERTAAFAQMLARRFDGGVTFVVFGGEAEGERNRAIMAGLAALGLADAAIDAGTKNGLLEFAALVELVDLLVTSDSLALHMAVALDVKLVAFFAPTSAAEIELFGLGEKVASTASDYCSYRADADNASITPERLVDAALRVLAAVRPDRAGAIARPARP